MGIDPRHSLLVHLWPFTQRVRVAPFTRTVTVHVSYTYKVKVKDGCVRWDYQNGGCRTWRYRTVTRTACCRTETRTESVFNYEDRAVYNYEDRTVYNYETRDVFNYEDRDVYNYETRDVFNYEDRDVYNYETRDVFNYEDRDVFNYAPVYETRTRQVAKTRNSDLVCADGYDPVQGSESCSKQTVTTSPANHDCPATHPTKIPVYMCQRTQLTDPTGCPINAPDSNHTLEKVTSLSSPSTYGWYCKPTGTASFGPPSGQRFANDRNHTYKSVESNDAEHNLWHKRFAGAGGEDIYNQTDISLSGLPRNSEQIADVHWFVAADVPTVAEYSCVSPVSSSICGLGRIRIKSDAHNLKETLRNNLVCHELGHSIGFEHGSSRTSCMTGGDNNQLDVWEIRAINLKY